MALGRYTDQELLAQGDEGAFAEFYGRFRPKVRRFAMQVAKSNDAADEIVQNVLKRWNQRHNIFDIQNLPG